jgi:hypothetical protein
MTWLLVVLAWTLGALVAAPVVGRFLAHAAARPADRVRPAIPRQRAPIPSA